MSKCISCYPESSEGGSSEISIFLVKSH